MANFSALIADIQAYVKQNGNNDIEGNGLQQILVAMVNSIGGASNEVAADLTAEVTARGNADYNLQQSIAAEAQSREGAVNGEAYQRTQADNALHTLVGYYECDTAGATAAKEVAAAGYVLPTTGGSVKIKMANRNTVANATLNINSTGAKPLFYNGVRAGVGNTWDTNEVVEVYYDGTNYQAHNVAGSSGDGVFDISAYNLTEGQPTSYADLSAALGVDGANVPMQFRKGGMSVKFVLDSDNNYVQFRYRGTSVYDTPFTMTSNWQGVDVTPTPNSKNLVESGGTLYNIRKLNQESDENFQNILESSGISLIKSTSVTESGSLVGAYINASGRIKASSSNNIKLHYYQVSIGDTVLINGHIDTDWTGQAVVFTRSVPQTETPSDFIVKGLNSGGNINMLYVAPCDGYIVTQERDSSEYVLCYNYTVKNQNGEDIDEIKELIGVAEVLEFLNPTGSENGLYISAAGQIKTAGNGILKYYSVTAGEKLHIYGDLSSDWGYGSAVFTESIPAVGVSTQVISLSYAVDMDYVAPANGYVVLQKNYNTGLEINLYKKETISDIDIINEILEPYLGEGQELEIYNTIATSYMTAAGKIKSVTTASMYCQIYKVYKDVPIIVSGYMGESMPYTSAAFFVNVPQMGDTASYIISKEESTINEIYTPTQDGYVVTWHRSNGEVTSAYNSKYDSRVIKGMQKDISDIEDEIDSQDLQLYPLKGKTVAVFGDSIMQGMGSYPSDVVVTLKNYDDPTDTTVYQQSDATLVNGIIYLTSSLSGGSVTENSIRLEVVNDKQSEIDSRTWTQLKDALKADDVINCGFNTAVIVEKGICTSYPTVGILEEGQEENPWDGKMASLPNEVKMLKRIVDDGLRDAPDAAVIWMGVNGSSEIITDTYEEAMAIPWATLSDDVNGYTYRTKFYGAMRYAIEYLYRAFPYINIFILSPVQTDRGDQSINSSDPAYRGYTELNELATAMKKISDRYACKFVDSLHEIGIANFSYKADSTSGTNEISTGVSLGNLCPTFLKDGLHPNSAGKVVWKNYLAKRLNALYFSKS